jgi:hypothetical protein
MVINKTKVKTDRISSVVCINVVLLNVLIQLITMNKNGTIEIIIACLLFFASEKIPVVSKSIQNISSIIEKSA